MQEVGLGGGLAALGFWLFLALVIIAAYWDTIRKREAQHETVRRAIEGGQEIDEQMINKLMSLGSSSGGSRADRDFKITAMWILPIAPGLVILGYALSFISAEAFYPLLGAAGLLACLGVGFWLAGMFASRWYTQD